MQRLDGKQQKFRISLVYFLSIFLAKLQNDVNEIHENNIDNDINTPVPEYDTAIEQEESNTKWKVEEVWD